MHIATSDQERARYARCIEASKRVRWDIDRDVIRGRRLDLKHKFLPDGLTLTHELKDFSAADRRYLGQVQGRTYANIFGLVERFINAKVLEISRDHWLGDQVALEALVRFSDEELKHQELFRRIEQLCADGMASGYVSAAEPNAVASAVLGKSTWAVLGLTLFIELFTQAHYRESIEHDVELSPLFKDVFLFHWKEESQHAILDELEWRRADKSLPPAARDLAVDDLIALVTAVDGLVRAQALADADYFVRTCGRALSATEVKDVETLLVKAYRWQYIHSGAAHPHFQKVLGELITPAHADRIQAALATLD